METEAKINVKEIDSSQKSPTQAWQECQEFPAKRISSENSRKGFIRWKEIVFEIFSPAPGFVPDEVLSTTGIVMPFEGNVFSTRATRKTFFHVGPGGR